MLVLVQLVLLLVPAVLLLGLSQALCFALGSSVSRNFVQRFLTPQFLTIKPLSRAAL